MRTRRWNAVGLMVLAIGCLLQTSPRQAVAQRALRAQDSVSFQASMATFNELVKPFLARHCTSCHGTDDPAGQLDLTSLDPDMRTTSAARWALLREQLVSGQMPPEGEERPSDAGMQHVLEWIKSELKRSGKHLARRAVYHNGNTVPHHMLFGVAASPGLESPPQARMLRPEIYDSLTDQTVRNVPGLGQPFSPSAGTTFRDMGTPLIDEPTTQALLGNALRIAERQLDHKVEDGRIVKVGSTPKEYLRLVDDDQPPTAEELETAIRMQFDRVLRRKPAADEVRRFADLYQQTRPDAGCLISAKYMLAGVFLLPDAVFRWESGTGEPDALGRVRLAPREIAFALAYALTDQRPESWLLRAAEDGELDSRAGVATAARRMLDEPKLAKPRIMRFFREYFGYADAVEIFKERQDNTEHQPRILVADTDRLIESILEQDENVLYELLTTNRSFVAYQVADDLKQKRADEARKFAEKKKQEPEKYRDKQPRKIGKSVYESYNLDDFPDEQPVQLPIAERAGILTQPSWLVAWSKSDGNDAIRRGKWIRERLLGGVVPDIPITVDAQLPEDPTLTLRQRMHVTRESYCWQCHTYMNRLGLPFEMFDHFGRYRTTEPVLDREATAGNVVPKGRPQGPVMRELPVDATGGVEHVPDPALEGPVENAVKLLKRLADSQHVEQVFVRHAFRFWMGRNETPGDASTLQEVHRAYREQGGSMRALLVTLLSSDAFLYRVPVEEP